MLREGKEIETEQFILSKEKGKSELFLSNAKVFLSQKKNVKVFLYIYIFNINELNPLLPRNVVLSPL